MKNDRNDDQQVSAAYSDLASERAPKHLDDSVMRMAKAHVEHLPYSRWTAWSRPLAWAATVSLCLAITLEVTQVTSLLNSATETAPAEVTTPAAESDMDQLLYLPDSMADSIDSEKISPARSAAKQVANEPAPAPVLEAKEDYLQKREERPAAAAYKSAGYATSAAITADMPDSECSATARSDPESWLECIAALEAGGDEQAALRQREMLIDTFPDFNLP